MWDDERGYSWTVVLGSVGGRKRLDFEGGIEIGTRMRGGGGGGGNFDVGFGFASA